MKLYEEEIMNAVKVRLWVMRFNNGDSDAYDKQLSLQEMKSVSISLSAWMLPRTSRLYFPNTYPILVAVTIWVTFAGVRFTKLHFITGENTEKIMVTMQEK